MNNYLFLFTISPVQRFIALARKTQDLYAGSYLLSHLCRVGGKKAEKLSGNKTIFPNLENYSIPNRFIIQFNTDQNLQQFGEEIEYCVRSEIKKIANVILTNMDIQKPPYHFYDQMQHYFSIFWVFYPNDNKGYAHAYREIERLMGAIKNVRAFKQLKEVGRKCSLDGQYNALFYKRRVNGRPPAFITKNINGLGDPIELKADFRIQAGEGLSAVSFLKRFIKEADSLFRPKFSYNSHFPSTARIALLHILSKFENSGDINQLISLKKYRDFFGRDFDEQLYFEENLTKNYFQKQGMARFVDAIPKLKNELKEIKKLISLKRYKFTKYYALIMYDTDNMGEWLSGKFLKIKKQSELEYFHKTLTEKLSNFGNYTLDYIDNNNLGKVVYSAGEELLGFLNISYLFKTLKHLREKFDQQLDLSEFSDDKITFSAGIVVAHYKMPLSEVFKWARKMGKIAKNMRDKKNAFAIAVMKHSGEIEQSVLPWFTEHKKENLNQQTFWFLDILENVTRNINKEYFSNTFIKNLSYELLKLKDNLSDLPNNELKEAMEYELKRLIERSYIEGNVKEEIRKKRIEKMQQNILKLFKTCMEYWEQQPVNNFLSTLHIIDFISREVSYVD